jgi:hypothetical protein
MEVKVDLDLAYAPSEDVVAREIEGELIIVPLAAGIGDVEDEIYTLNETGRAIWGRLDGRKSLRLVAQELGAEYDSPAEQLEKDVLGFVGELLRRRMLVESSGV